jgi:hypothetical protein
MNPIWLSGAEEQERGGTIGALEALPIRIPVKSLQLVVEAGVVPLLNSRDEAHTFFFCLPPVISSSPYNVWITFPIKCVTQM